MRKRQRVGTGAHRAQVRAGVLWIAERARVGAVTRVQAEGGAQTQAGTRVGARKPAAATPLPTGTSQIGALMQVAK